jgi:hypothetical protein
MTIVLLLAAVHVEPERPRAGEEARIRVENAGRPQVGIPVVAVEPAGGTDAIAETVGTTGAGGTLAWTPARAGLVRLEAGTDATVVAIGPATPRWAGAAALAFVVVLLAAPAAWAHRAWRRSGGAP